MRKIYTLLLIIGLLSVSFGCLEDDGDSLDVYREVAYNALTADMKATVISDWKKAEVTAWTNGNYLVIFESTDSGLADVRVVVDPETARVVEILPRI
ncbi:MAG TPA: hypothetical protein VLA71_11140 [Algoriphagus sp.]|jgi:hypothetical protein|nr:hypothetical protein [Algoriphagus sp.]